MAKQVIIILGTGRCGTKSLAHILNTLPRATVTHEAPPLLPWEPSPGFLDQKLSALESRSGDVVGDAAFYYLPYVRHIATRAPDVIFICLKRAMKSTVVSYMRWTVGRNHWCVRDDESRPDPRWDPCYPKYEIQNKIKALEMYWKEYYDIAHQFEKELERFTIVPLEDLNSPSGLERILDLIDIPKTARVPLEGVHINRGGWRSRHRVRK